MTSAAPTPTNMKPMRKIFDPAEAITILGKLEAPKPKPKNLQTRKRHKFTPEVIAAVIAAYERGVEPKDIALSLGSTTTSYIYKTLRLNGAKMRRAPRKVINRKPPIHITTENLDLIKRYIALGTNPVIIAKIVGCSERTVQRIMHDGR